MNINLKAEDQLFSELVFHSVASPLQKFAVFMRQIKPVMSTSEILVQDPRIWSLHNDFEKRLENYFSKAPLRRLEKSMARLARLEITAPLFNEKNSNAAPYPYLNFMIKHITLKNRADVHRQPFSNYQDIVGNSLISITWSQFLINRHPDDPKQRHWKHSQKCLIVFKALIREIFLEMVFD